MVSNRRIELDWDWDGMEWNGMGLDRTGFIFDRISERSLGDTVNKVQQQQQQVQ